MTASCPGCGGKWDIEGVRPHNPDADFCVLIPEGSRIVVHCYYCNREIEYHLCRDQETQFAVDREAELYKIIHELEAKK